MMRRFLSAISIALVFALLMPMTAVGEAGVDAFEDVVSGQVDSAIPEIQEASLGDDLPGGEDEDFELPGEEPGDAAEEAAANAEADSANAVGDRSEGAKRIGLDAIRAAVRKGGVSSNGGTVAAMVDIVFIIDSTGSMWDAINNVINNLNQFTVVLEESGIDFRIAIVDYKDWEDGEETRILKDDSGNSWFTTADKVDYMLNTIDIDGGGDTPETVLDALGCMLYGGLEYRDGASKFAILLTDADYKTYNSYGFSSMSDAIEALISAGFCTSVIARTDDQDYYTALYTRTEGIFCDIYSPSFSNELLFLAEYVRRSAQPVKIVLQSMRSVVSGGVAKYVLDMLVTSLDPKLTINDLKLALMLPENATTKDSLTVVVPSLGPNDSRTFRWIVYVPVEDVDSNYVWQVEATSDDFKAGVVCASDNTFSVPASMPDCAALEASTMMPIGIKDTTQLTIEVPEGVTVSNPKWKSSQPKIASVSASGLVTGKGKGKAKITMTADGGLTASIDVEVEDLHAPTKIRLFSEKGTRIFVNESIPLTTTMEAISTPVTKLTWKSSSSKVAKVDKNGVVTGKSEGVTTITVTTANKLTAFLDITVKDPSTPTEMWVYTPDTTVVPLKEKLQLYVYFYGGSGAKTKLKWTSSDKKIASVNNKGVVTGKKAGYATIIVTTKSGALMDSIDIEVRDVHAPYDIWVWSDEGTTMAVKDKFQLSYDMACESGTPKTKLKWTSSNKKVASVNNKGLVTAKSPGYATIRVTTSNKAVYAEIGITVE